MGKPLDSSASFRLSPSCLSASFYRMYSFWNLISLSPPVKPVSALDQILLSISNGFNKAKQSSQTILATLDFSIAFNSFLYMCLWLNPSFCLVSNPSLYLYFFLRPLQGVPFFSVHSLTPVHSLLCFARAVSISQCYQGEIPSPCGQSRHHRLLLVLPYLASPP